LSGRTSSWPRAEADEIIARESDVKKGGDLKATTDDARKKLKEAQDLVAAFESRSRQGRRAMTAAEAKELTQYNDAKALIPVLEKNLATAQKVEADFRTKVALQRDLDEKKEMDRRLGEARKFNERLAEVKANDKGNKLALPSAIDINDEAMYGDKAVFDNLLKAKQDALNQKLGSFTPKTSEARSEELAATRALIKAMNDEQAAFKQSIRFRKELEDARYSDQRFGPQLASVLAEQRAIDGINESIRIEIDQRRRLQEALSGPNLNQADRKSIEAELDHRQANITLLRQELQHKAQINALNAIERARQTSAEASLERAKLAADDKGQIGKLNQSVSTKVEDSTMMAASNARIAVEQRYRDAVVKREQDVLTAKEAVRALEEEGMGLTEGYTAEELKRLNAANAHLSVQEALLTALKDQAATSATTAAEIAAVNDRYMQSAEYGFKKFWKEYQEQGVTAAKQVEEAMKGASSKMEDALAQFVTTGKLNFKSLVASILADIARIMARRAFMQVLNYAAGAFGGGGGGSVGTDMGGWTSGGGYGTGTGVAGFEKGGIMTSAGRCGRTTPAAWRASRRSHSSARGASRKPMCRCRTAEPSQ
jgi:lambda family phage tail tape measure protein